MPLTPITRIGLLIAGLAPAAIVAQSSEQRSVIPAGYQPPPGMCRIWITGVPPGKQPAPTDCATALRNKPANAVVEFGKDAPRGAPARGSAPPAPPAGRGAARGDSGKARDSVKVKRDTIPQRQR